MSLKLYTYQPNYRAWKVLIAAAYNDVKVEMPAFNFGVDNKTAEFLKKNPFGKVPVLETPQGCVFESNAIARYVAAIRADTELLGSTLLESAQVAEWVDASANELEPATAILMYKLLNIMEISDEQFSEAKEDVEKFLRILDGYLLTRTFLVGNKVTLADITVVSALVQSYQKVFNCNFQDKYVNLNRWFQTCVNQPAFAKVIGKVDSSSCASTGEEKVAEQKPQKQEKQGKKEKQEKPAKQEKQGKKEKQEKKEKPKEEASADAGDEEPKEKKPKSALDTLPPSSMKLDAVKKLFFEKRPNFAEFFTEFWNMFDAEGYSLYLADYKFNEDNRVYFMTCNLTGGYIQRLEELRKYAFGVLNVTGKDEDTPPFEVNGAFIFRGTDVPAEMTECPDTEYYALTKLDASNDEHRQLLEQAFYGDTFKGQAVLDRKYFK